jgi:hypothetical protein
MNIQNLDWQTIVALLIVSAAIVVLARKSWKGLFQPATSGCGTGCSSCPSSQSSGSVKVAKLKVTKLIQIGGGSKDEG